MTTRRTDEHDKYSRYFPPTRSRFYRFKLGNFQVVSVSDGGTLLQPMKMLYAPDASEDEYRTTLRNHVREAEPEYSHLNTLFVGTGDNKILIDTGAGSMLGPGCGKQRVNLLRAGIDPDSIDSIILSHGHVDHVGGILNESGDSNFPNARFFISKEEWDFWTADHVTIGQRIPEQMKEMAIHGAKHELAAIKDRVTFVKPGEFVFPSIEAIDARGHAPGQLAFRIISGEDTLVYAADTMHSTAISLEHPEWANALDNDQVTGCETRLAFLKRLATERTLITVPHFPFPGLGRISQTVRGYGWEPLLWEW
jgi:glyoxylase-like metal-dependent hydrolase (beta-lactamase superfamily II)